MTILSDIEKLAAEVAKNALEQDTGIESRIDALKVLTPYYNALKKAQGQTDPDPPDQPTMAAFQDRLRQAEEKPNGGTVPNHQRRSRTQRTEQ